MDTGNFYKAELGGKIMTDHAKKPGDLLNYAGRDPPRYLDNGYTRDYWLSCYCCCLTGMEKYRGEVVC